MIDQRNQNPLTVTGTPTLVTGGLTVDTNQALQFNGTTNSAAVTDSASLSITNSLSVELFVRVTALPGTTKDIVRKTGSYAVQMDSSGHILFALNGSVIATSSVTLTTNRWYHVVCVYNNEYAGPQQFGKWTAGSQQTQVDDDNGQNKAVGKFTLAEAALLDDVNVSLQYNDEIWPVQMNAVVYADNAGAPAALVTQSGVAELNPPNPQWRTPTWVNFPLTRVVAPAGSYHIGFIADTQSGPLPKAPLTVGSEATGGTTSRRADSVGSPSNPFGTVTSSSGIEMAVYCTYTAIARSGSEGSAVIYVDGAQVASSAYNLGIADTSNALEICPALAALVDEVSIWNRPLTDVQVATHYTAH